MENNKNRKNDPFIKVNYYPGKLLHASDFVKEQAYGNRKTGFLNRSFHGHGIIEGLEVRMGQEGEMRLAPGSALDAQGRILIVPEETKVVSGMIEGFQQETLQDFVLGIRYAERPAEKERSFLGKEDSYQAAGMEETFALKAYSWKEWLHLEKDAQKKQEILTEEKVVYNSKDVKLTVSVPRLIPSDSIFRFRMQAQVSHGKSVEIGWKGLVKLQGAFFAASGNSIQVVEEKQALCSGCLQREWEICTEENNSLPVMLELSHLEVASEGSGSVNAQVCRFYIETSGSYDAAARKMIQKKGVWETEVDWIPLAYLRAEKISGEERILFSLRKDREVRFFAVNPKIEDTLRRASEENGIVDIRWRKLFKSLNPNPPVLPGPYPPGPLPPCPIPPCPEPPKTGLTEEQVRELLEEEREKRMRRGIAVIPIPRHYRRGQILLSEEIGHGFPGEEVFLWCGKIREEQHYAYWERSKMQYDVIQGAEKLFAREGGGGWEIEQQAVRQNVEKGTFQIALTLARHFRKSPYKEVAVSWIAVRTV